MFQYARFVWIVMLITVMQGNAFALGLGFYGAVQGGEADWEVENDFGPDLNFDGGDISKASIGFTLDTAVLKDTVFNYRLNVGPERFDADLGDTQFTAELGGIAADNSFGFGVLRTENVRLWVGPRVRVAIYGGDFNDDSNVDVALVEFGVGGVFGGNFGVGRTVALGFETGFMISGYAGIIDDGSEEPDFTGEGTSVFLNGVVLFRLGNDKR